MVGDFVKIPFKGTHILKSDNFHETYCGIDVFKENSFELCSRSKKTCLVCAIEKHKQEADNEQR